MTKINILVFEQGDSIGQKFKQLSQNSFSLLIVSDIDTLVREMEEHPQQLLVTSRELYLEHRQLLKPKPGFKDLLLAVYTDSGDQAEKSDLYADGIWFSWNITVGTSQLAERLGFINNRQDFISRFEENSISHGSLLNVELEEVLATQAFAGKSVKLELYASYGRIDIYFVDGRLTHARQGRLTGNEAAIRGFLWTHGTFFVRELPAGIDLPVSVTASLTALITEGLRRRNDLWKSIAKTYDLNAPLKLIGGEDKGLDGSVAERIEIFNGNHSMIHILLSAETEYPAFLEQITALLASGIISQVTGPDQRSETPRFISDSNRFFSRTEAFALEEVLFTGKPDLENGIFLFVGSQESGLTEIIRTMGGKLSGPLKKVDNFIVSDIMLNKKKLSLLGMPLDKKFMDALESISGRILGFVFLIDARDNSEMGYASYVVNSMLKKFSGGLFSVVLTHSEKARALPRDMIKNEIQLPDFAHLHDCDIENPESIKALIFSLKVLPN